MKKSIFFTIFMLSFISFIFSESFIRINQIGYFPDDKKTGVVFSNDDISDFNFSVIRLKDNSKISGPKDLGKNYGEFGSFKNNYIIDFSDIRDDGIYYIELSDGTKSPEFNISKCAYKYQHEAVLNFFHFQRCGYNPYFNTKCHLFEKTSRRDAKAKGGPDDGKNFDASGGWHDAGDYIKFMITTTNVTYFLLFSYLQNPDKFLDNYLSDGTIGKNNIPDVLDEAKYGLDFIMKMNPSDGVSYFQVGDEKDHNFWRLPDNDMANYDEAPMRPAYFGIGANNCARASASFSLAYKIWKDYLKDETYAEKCLLLAKKLYELARKNLRVLPSIPPDFYNETSFYDDMELAAVELYKITNNSSYLKQAEMYGLNCGSGNGYLDWSSINFIAHYNLAPFASDMIKDKLREYMKSDLDYNLQRYNSNIFGMSADYIWGSMSVLTGVIIKAYLYQKLFNNKKYYDMLISSRDYLLGKNQWGVCFIVGMGKYFPENVHSQPAKILKEIVFGMPIEGPMKKDEWEKLNIRLSGQSKYNKFNSDIAVYYDDSACYATNEMTIYQGALTLCMFSLIGSKDSCEDVKPFIRQKSKKVDETKEKIKPKNIVLIDNCEDGNNINDFGKYWYTYDDKSNGGDSYISPEAGKTFKMTEKGARNSKYCAGFKGKVTTKYQYGYIGMGTSLSETYIDISVYKGIRFYAKGDNKSYNVVISPDRSKVDTEYNDYRFTFLAPENWTLINIPFTSFSQDLGWGKKTELSDNLKYIRDIIWQTISQPLNSVELYVDEIGFYK